MSERKMKRVADSMTEQSHLLMPKCLNAAGYLFGGQLLAWIDETAGIVAKRHAEMNVVTVAVDNMYFKTGGSFAGYLQKQSTVYTTGVCDSDSVSVQCLEIFSQTCIVLCEFG